MRKREISGESGDGLRPISGEPAAYESYARFCHRVHVKPLAFEDWREMSSKSGATKSDYLGALVPR